METITKRGPNVSADKWLEIEHRACAGVQVQTLSQVYGVSVSAINQRACKYQWETPIRVNRRTKAALAGKPAFQTPNPPNLGQLTKDSEENSAISPVSVDSFNQALATLVNSPPADFQKALGGVAQAAIAAGVPSIAPPQNLKDLATWIDIFRKTNGLDKPDKGAGITLLVNPMRTVSRRSGPVVEAEPAEYPAGDPAGVDEWEP